MHGTYNVTVHFNIWQLLVFILETVFFPRSELKPEKKFS
jgi:hypothetical protein